MNRREFLKITGLGALLGAVGVKVAVAEPVKPMFYGGIWGNYGPPKGLQYIITNSGTFQVVERPEINPRGFKMPLEIKK